jgi:hypothetical protein
MVTEAFGGAHLLFAAEQAQAGIDLEASSDVRTS